MGRVIIRKVSTSRRSKTHNHQHWKNKIQCSFRVFGCNVQDALLFLIFLFKHETGSSFIWSSV